MANGVNQTSIKMLILQGFLYTLIAALTPVYAAILSDIILTTRVIIGVSIGAIIAGATALKAFLSTTFSDSNASEPEKP